MANKTRKDKKGYTLRTGECQRKDGRYSFAYTDRWKKRHIVYATSLVDLRELEKAKAEGREPILLPMFSAHQLRHTFCTRFCENETNLKVIQSIMGHSDITTTMDIYADATQEKK